MEETIRLQVEGVLEILSPAKLGIADRIAAEFVTESRRSFERVRPLLARLRRRWSLAVVSNFYGNLESVLDSEGLLDLFSAVADSGVVGCLKPDPDIFRHALDKLDVRPNEACMIGDSLERDMKGAERLGMAHAWLQGSRPARSVCCPKAKTLSNLEDLETFLPQAGVLEARS